ncbi:MAG: hypothetical protein IKW85_04765 [Muribaculaceae bacterium]|nr:hypothetical protein [Muribaculaceae bacterium]
MKKTIVHIKYWLLLMLMVVGNYTVSFAAIVTNDANTDSTAVSLLEQTIKKNQSLDKTEKSLNRQIKELNNTIKALDKDLQNADKELKKQQQQLEKIQPKKNQDEEADLAKRQQDLQDKLERLDKENKALEEEIKSLNLSWDKKIENLKELEGIQQGMAEDFVNKNESYLEQAFSKMSMPRLRELQEKCAAYQGDQKVDTFSKKLEKVIDYKKIYDTADSVVKQPFDRNAVTNARRSLKPLLSQLNHLTKVQADSVTRLQQQLDGFETGLVTFKEFITYFRDNCKYISSSEDVKTEVGYIHKKKNAEGKTMEWRIDNEINAIPYLRDMFAQYMTAIKDIKAIQAYKRDPKNVPKVETKILEQYNNNIKQ